MEPNSPARPRNIENLNQMNLLLPEHVSKAMRNYPRHPYLAGENEHSSSMCLEWAPLWTTPLTPLVTPLLSQSFKTPFLCHSVAEKHFLVFLTFL